MLQDLKLTPLDVSLWIQLYFFYDLHYLWGGYLVGDPGWFTPSYLGSFIERWVSINFRSWYGLYERKVTWYFFTHILNMLHSLQRQPSMRMVRIVRQLIHYRRKWSIQCASKFIAIADEPVPETSLLLIVIVYHNVLWRASVAMSDKNCIPSYLWYRLLYRLLHDLANQEDTESWGSQYGDEMISDGRCSYRDKSSLDSIR